MVGSLGAPSIPTAKQHRKSSPLIKFNRIPDKQDRCGACKAGSLSSVLLRANRARCFPGCLATSFSIQPTRLLT